MLGAGDAAAAPGMGIFIKIKNIRFSSHLAILS